MKLAWTRWTTWFQGQPLRQQALVIGAAVVVGIGAIDALVWAPAEKAQRVLRTQIAALTEQGQQRRSQAQAQASEQQRMRAEEKALRERLTAADATIARARSGLTGAEALRQRIRDLSADGAMQLVSLTTLPAEPVSPGAKTPAFEGATLLYRMPVTATVVGSYAALRDHLAKLEADEAGLAWQSLALDNAGWPQIRMELRLMLTSDRPQWRGP